MTFTSKIRQEAYIAIKTSVDPKTEIKVGRWNSRTMFLVGKTAHTTTDMYRYCLVSLKS